MRAEILKCQTNALIDLQVENIKPSKQITQNEIII